MAVHSIARDWAGARLVNDVHSMLNQTEVREVLEPDGPEALARIVRNAGGRGVSLSVCGGRHAMGGQQFLSNGILLDMRRLNQLIELDDQRGIVSVGAGITWGELIDQLSRRQRNSKQPWVIAQKPTGADDISIGGSVSSNAHGRGLSMQPLVGDITALSAVLPGGELTQACREQNAELFRSVVGGYGSLAIVHSVSLRLLRRCQLQRVVELTTADRVVHTLEKRAGEGCLYGDFQFAIDNCSDDFLHKGILSCYEPVPDDTPPAADQRVLSLESWRRLIKLAHEDKSRAFHEYSEHYRRTHGQVYQSDTLQLSAYEHGYHRHVDGTGHGTTPGSEIISELYVPRRRLYDFLQAAADYFRCNRTNVIYGTVRLIKKEDVTLLPWATQDYACVVFNIHTQHTDHGLQRSRQAFRHLIDLAIDRGGSFYLTYHRFAERRQLKQCYPNFRRFLQLKDELDPHRVLDSNWLRHTRHLLGT